MPSTSSSPLTLFVLEDRSAPSKLSTTTGSQGINSQVTNLTGEGVLIGQVEEGRPGRRSDKPADDKAQSHPDVEPEHVYVIDQDAKKNDQVNDHAIGVAGIMIGKDLGEDGATYGKGVAHKATLYSAAAEVQGPLGSKIGKGHQIAEQFVLAVQKVSEKKGNDLVRAINVSWGVNPFLFEDPMPKLNGLSTMPLALDYFTVKRDTLFVKSGGNSTGDPEVSGTHPPTDAYNSLVVSGLEEGIEEGKEYWRVGKFSETAVGVEKRVLTHVVAPGDLKVAERDGDNGKYVNRYGSSQAAPHVTGVVALLHQHAKKETNGIPPEGQHHLVMKAVIINSAEKLKGVLAADKTALRKNGTDWTDSKAKDRKGNEDPGKTLPLDDHIGAGAVDAERAVTQLGQRVKPDDAAKAIAWDYGDAKLEGNGTHADIRYTLPKVEGGKYVSATLVWDRVVKLTDFKGAVKDTYEGGKKEGQKDKFTADPVDNPLANLDLYLVPTAENGDVTKAVWESVSTDYNIEHIFFKVDATSQQYDLIVRQKTKGSTPYALAWWTEAAAPSPPPPVNPRQPGGLAWDDVNRDGTRQSGEPVMEDVRVELFAGSTLLETRSTDSDGEYQFNPVEAAGSYQVKFTAPTGHSFTVPNAFGNTVDDVDSDVNSAGESATLTINTLSAGWVIDAGLHLTPGVASIGERVWHDRNADGEQESGEPGVAGVPVALKDMAGNVVQSVTSGADGGYLFSGVQPGRYRVEFTPPSGHQFSTGGPEQYLWAYAGDSITDLDAGLFQPATVGDRVWLDADEDGLQDPGEAGLAGVQVELLAGGQAVDYALTDVNGNYSFVGLYPGEYSLRFSSTVVGYDLTAKDQGSDDAADTDADPATGETAAFTLASGEVVSTWDAGMTGSGGSGGSFGDYVWADTNANGVQDPGESGVGGVTVRLLEGGYGWVVDSTTTDPSGHYSFVGLWPGTYRLEFILPSGLSFSPANTTTDTHDSDADPVTGRTGTISLAANEHRPDLDAGLFASGGSGGSGGSIGDRVWYDADQDGVQDAGEYGFLGVAVNLLDGAGGVVASTTTDSDGRYLFSGLGAGVYGVEFVAPAGHSFSPVNVTFDDLDSDAGQGGRTGLFALAAGAHKPTLDAGLSGYAGSGGSGGFIGDRVWDDLDADGVQDAGEAGRAGVAVRLLDGSGNLLAATTTDAGGLYAFTGLGAGVYQVEFVAPAGSSFSPRHAPTSNTLDSDADPLTGRTAAIYLPANKQWPHVDAGVHGSGGSIGDRVWDDADHDGVQDLGESGLAGVPVHLLGGSGAVLATTTTDGYGYYAFSSLGAGTYEVQFVAPAGYSFSPANAAPGALDSDANPYTGRTGTFALAANQQVVTLDAGLYGSGGSGGSGGLIGDRVWDDVDHDGVQDAGESGRAGVGVNLLNAAGGLLASTTSDASGYYAFANLAAGTYQVEFTLPSGYSFSPVNAATAALDSDAGAGGRSGLIALAANESRADIDAGVYGSGGSGGSGGSIGHRVWNDVDQDGIQDSGESGAGGVIVRLLNGSGGLVATATTDASGNYGFSGLAAGTYQVEYVLPSGYSFSPADATADTQDSDANTSTGRTGTLTLAAGEQRTDVDAGMYGSGGSGGSGGWIGDRVWDDVDADGIQDAGESGRPGVTVNLRNGSGTLVASTTTDAYGNYGFGGLAAGTYEVQFVPQYGYTVSPADATTDTLDSDADPYTGWTGPITLAANESRSDIDAGVYGLSGGSGGSIGDRVWLDADADGVQDVGEYGAGGVTVRLLNASGVVIATAYTDSYGYYTFAGLGAGTYEVEFVTPSGYSVTTANATTDTTDSDANTTTGRTGTFALAAGEHRTDLDAGLIGLSGSGGSGGWIGVETWLDP